MIKFFRKIRKKLVEENKLRNYLIYAFGEIVLVVIGILIALQINTINENSKKEDIKKTYYNQILQDLSKDHKYLNLEVKRLVNNINLYKDYRANFSKHKSLEELIYSQMKLNYFYMYLKFNTNTIETLQSTGDIKLMPTLIRNNLIDLKNAQDNLIKTSFGNDDNFAEALIEATKLGFLPSIKDFVNTENKSNELYTKLKVKENLSEIALIVNAAYQLKNLTETDQLNTSKSLLIYISNLFEIINKELDQPYISIESVINEKVKLEKLINEGKTIDEIIKIVKQQDKENSVYDISENYINELGYWYMNTAKQNEQALKLFKLNTEIYPDAWNAYDSYGECLLKMGETKKAVEAYKKSLELNPENETAKKVISEN